MFRQYLISFVVCSLTLQGFAESLAGPRFAEQASKEASPSKKIKPHFAGVKKTVKSSEKDKKPKKVKNPWFFSKTQLKPSKKRSEKGEGEVVQAPSDLPYLTGTNSLAASSSPFFFAESQEDSPASPAQPTLSKNRV